MNEIISLVVAGIFLYVYVILSSIEFGSSLFVVFPKLTTRKDLVKLFINPVWGTTNVFLVFFVISLFVFFPGAVLALNPLLPIIFAALAVFGVRILATLYSYYVKNNNRFVHWILLITSFLGPIIFAQAFLFMMTGQINIFGAQTFFMALLVASIIVSVAISFFKVLADESYSQNLYTILGMALAAFISSINGLVLTLMYPTTQLLSNPTINIVFCMLSTLALVMLFWAYSRKKNSILFASICSLVAILLGTFFAYQIPYIVYPNVSIYGTFVSQEIFPWLLGSFVLGYIFVVPSLVLLFNLVVFNKVKVIKD